jgi:hypothetical protein
LQTLINSLHAVVVIDITCKSSMTCGVLIIEILYEHQTIIPAISSLYNLSTNNTLRLILVTTLLHFATRHSISTPLPHTETSLHLDSVYILRIRTPYVKCIHLNWSTFTFCPCRRPHIALWVKNIIVWTCEHDEHYISLESMNQHRFAIMYRLCNFYYVYIKEYSRLRMLKGKTAETETDRLYVCMMRVTTCIIK